MKASFGDLNVDFDLARFSTSDETTGATLSGSLDLNKLTQLGAGEGPKHRNSLFLIEYGKLWTIVLPVL